MKYLKKIFETKNIPENIKQDIKDICLDTDFIGTKYSYNINFNIDPPYIQFFHINNLPFKANIFEDIIDHIKYYLHINNYNCRIFYMDLNSVYYNDKPNIFYDNKWNPTVSRIIIKFYNKLEIANIS